MTAHCLTLAHQTRLAVQIVIEDDTGMLAYSIQVFTQFFALFYQVSQTISTIQYEMGLLTQDIKSALTFTSKVLAIGLGAVAYGCGVTQ